MPENPISRRTPRWLLILRYSFIILCLAAILFGAQTVKIITDWQWFGEMHQRAVFIGILQARLLLFFGTGGLFIITGLFNIWLAIRMNETRMPSRMIDINREQITAAARKALVWLSFAGVIFFAFMIGGNAVTHWSEYLLFTHAVPYGQTDPIFHNDIGFYVFRLPFLNYLQNLFLFIIGLTAAGVFGVHYTYRAIDFVGQAGAPISSSIQKHLLTLAGIFAFVFAWGELLGRYDYLVGDNGVYFGAGYTDVHARIPVTNILAVIMTLVGILCFVNIWKGRPFRLPLAGLATWVIIFLIGAAFWPGFMQRFTVIPNQFGKEKTYIADDIHFTQTAYKLDHVEEMPFPGTKPVTAQILAANKTTIHNIRLWDWPQLGAVYSAKQARQTYYTFNLPASAATNGSSFDIDVDRYNINGEYRQVMLGAREMYQQGLPQSAQTWQNQHLQYTHGYGVVMSPVNEADSDGLPEYFLSQIPVQSSVPGMDVTVPQIYYGEQDYDYVFVDSKQAEFDYPSGEKNMETRYDGTGGILLGGMFNRTLWAIRTGDANILLSTDLTSKSRILFRRNIRNRVQTLAPFLNWDNDPYLIVNNGRLVWMMDAYTVSDRYPYSKSTYVGTGLADIDQVFNYIRNSVKATVDAYNGTVKFYVSDSSDPIIQAWERIFPSLFTQMDQMSPELKAHVRYPEDFFRFQRDIYTIYHINDPLAYYQKNDAWAVPQDPTAPTDSEGNQIQDPSQTRMMPYYIIMRLPGEKQEEYMMMTPFTYLSIPNMSGWMCAKCDPEDYGHLLLYRFPKDSTINGPANIIAQVNAQSDISQFRTLQDQRGSKVIFGNMLVIPVDSSLLFAIPVYVQSTGGGQASVPELRQVILASDDRIVMRPTLEQAIEALPTIPSNSSPAMNAGKGLKSQSPSGLNPVTGNSLSDLVNQVSNDYDHAKQKQQEYNSALDALGKSLQNLKNSLGTGNSSKK
jgi:uncharacterized membrane protein (UPF0182 family)